MAADIVARGLAATALELIGNSMCREAVIAWNGETTPDVTKIPSGVQVTYNGTTYTGTLAASAALKGVVEFVYDNEEAYPDVYKEYIVLGDSTYTWELMGSTAIDLASCVQYVAQEPTDSEKAIARDNIGAQAVVEIEVLGSSDT